MKTLNLSDAVTHKTPTNFDPILSINFRMILAVCIAFVVYIHAYNIGNGYIQNDTVILERIKITNFSELFISNGLAGFAVPTLFMLSGYLFFYNFQLSIYREKVRKRVRTLLMPYLIWCSIGVLIIFICQQNSMLNVLLERAHFVKNISKPVSDYNMSDWLARYVLEPAAFQLWYIRDLMVLILFSPAIYFLINKAPFTLISALALLWFCDLNMIWFHSPAWLFFTIGGMLGLNKINVIVNFPLSIKLLLCLVWFIVLLIKTTSAFYAVVPVIKINSQFFLVLMDKINVIVSILTMWTLISTPRERKGILIENLSLFYFVFLLHEPLQKILTQFLFITVGRSSAMMLTIYFIEPIFLIFFCVILAYVLKKHTFKFYSLLTGGR